MPQIPTTDLIAQFRSNHHEKLALCDRLEAIADSLPDNIDASLCSTTAKAIDPILSKAQEVEENKLYPALKKYYEDNFDQSHILDKLVAEHFEDRLFGEEVSEVLRSYGRGQPAQSADATGYMLRGFFEGLRRHMSYEEALLKPLRKQ